jgi:hypothetical protein
MADVWVVLTIVGFFAVCAGLVWACDRIIGPDDASDLAADPEEPEAELAATAR